MIGRESEIQELERLYESDNSEFVAVYGRRRIGKTFLIDETFANRITFRHAGLSPIEMQKQPTVRPLKQQLQAFYYALIYQGMKPSHCPKDWLEAFFMLEMYLQSIDDGSKQVVFLDELPWMDTPKSGFITGLEAFWNGWGCHRHNLMLIVCGSATSWMRDKLINNHGGLYGRLTCELKLSPFTLSEVEQFFQKQGVRLSRYDITQAYMIVGGIPYYLRYFRKSLSLAQNIDLLFFNDGAKLEEEYDRLFSSTFSNPDMMKSIIECLHERNYGFTRQEICKKTEYSDGGTLSAALNSLVVSDFIISYKPFGEKNTDTYYKLTDPFCLFYLRFVHNKNRLNHSFWLENVSSPKLISWRGYAFENVCFNHIKQIKQILGISGVSSTQSPWIVRGDENTKGTQVDLIISRKDHIINACEMKFCETEFAVDKKYDLTLRHREGLLEAVIPKNSAVHSTLITTYGIKKNEYQWSFVNVITLDDLFVL